MYKIIVFFFMISALPAADYEPYVRIRNNGQEMIWSGVLIEDHGGNILTVGHPFFGLPLDQINTEIDFEAPNKPKVTLSARLIKYDFDRDLGLLKVEGWEPYSKPISLAEGHPLVGSYCTSNGYVMFQPLRREVCYPRSYVTHTTLEGRKLTFFSGKSIIGLSGSAIVHNGKIISIQSGGNLKTEIIGADLEEIKLFLSDEWK